MSGIEIEYPSSPDPLVDEADDDNNHNTSVLAPPSTTRRFLQSAASSRFSAMPGTSPRKRMFALDVGNEITPQTIYVTVEAGPDGNPIAKAPIGTSVRRRLFGSPSAQPSPNRRVRTTTTTVPLRGLTDDEAAATPKRRRRSSGRPGTPAAGSTTKKKKQRATPATGRTKKMKGTPVPSSDILQSETPAGADRPTPRKRGRPPKRKSPDGPSEGNDDPSLAQTLPRKKGRRGRTSLGPDDLERLAAANSIGVESSVDRAHVSKSLEALDGGQGPDPISADIAADGEQADEEDIWMGGMSDTPLPKRRESASAAGEENTGVSEPKHVVQSDQQPELEDQGPLPGESDDYPPMLEYDDDKRSDTAFNPSDKPSEVEHDPTELRDQGPLPGESDDYAPLMEHEDRSDAESQRSERSAEAGDALDQTVDPDTFTMIGIETMPSFRGDRSMAPSDPPEIGETTSFFINRTLDSLRQEMAESDEDEVDVLVSRGPTPADDEPERPQSTASSPQDRFQMPSSPAHQPVRYSSRSPGRTESAPGSAADIEPHGSSPSPRRVQSNTADNLRSGPNSLGPEEEEEEDSFSDIPEEVLAAAEISGEEERQQFSRAGPGDQMDWTAPVVQKSVLDAGYDHLSSSLGDQAIINRPRSTQSTPSRSDRTQTDDNATISQESASRSVQSTRVLSQMIQRSSPPRSLRSRSDSNRLLTPDETTSSSDQSPPEGQIASNVDLGPIAAEDVGSSPPEIRSFTEDAVLPTLPLRRSSESPATRGPDIRVERVQEQHTYPAGLQSSHLTGPRPTLSPVVRIGRTLQNILSDPPSPSARGSVLGSPFKGSVRNSSPLDGAAVNEALQNNLLSNVATQNGPSQPAPHIFGRPAQSPPKPWTMAFAPLSQIRNLVTQGAQLFSSPRVNTSQALDDPFGPSSPTTDRGTENSRGTAFMNRIREASREGSAYSHRTGRLTINGDDKVRHRAPSLPPAMRSRVVGLGRTPTSLATGLDRPPDSRERDQQSSISNAFDGVYDDEADELAGDYNPEEVLQDQQQAVDPPLAQSVERRPSHGGLGSEEDGVHVEGDETQLEDARVDDQGEEEEEEEEDDIWAIEANRTASSPQALMPPDDTINSFKKDELSIDWGTQSISSFNNSRSGRSPGFRPGRSVHEVPPENLEDYSLVDLHSGASTQSSARKPTPEAQKQPKRVDLSDFFSSSPNFMERQRRAKEASLAKSAAQEPAPKLAHIASPEVTIRLQDPALRNPPVMTSELPSPAAGASQEGTRESTAWAGSTTEPEPAGQGQAQQAEFTPRQRQNDANLFESWSTSSRPLAGSAQDSDEPGSSSQPGTPENPVDSSFEAPDLRPLPDPEASPSKSCLRSPLKLKPAGRVVEFTSSTLSMSIPLPALVASRNETSLATAPDLPVSGPQLAGKENQIPSSHSIVDVPSLRQQHSEGTEKSHQETHLSLSQTQWSRRHWVLLDKFLQEYRSDPVGFEMRYGSTVMTSPRKQAPSTLVGKQVTSQGESMVLEPWHLDVVGAFKNMDGGWPEDVLAKRLFALLVGEKRRRLGLVPKRR
ncbi:hypothetical protein M406DRAFT_68275 [Cryphonectria parasitica EP155]|uniref:Uncharacterized protein n=1 Tax=Cryphonectria parasitica (strain ATCC 38755 / EP155) TaxID=660469 RepID=A0A9P4Y3J7_CRYP1|nr:uncharacterized protein M406DRAFT_68275 [Cryphonectria parasitica EP155]KAF3765878.1 hypothetical protein M406DRAFT_68275 [Cryphonectria parasitica EP155]